LAAKLFGSAALVIAATGFFINRFTRAPFGIVTTGHISFSADQLLLAFALLCAVFAALYYLVDRGAGAHLSHALSISHFLLWMFAIVAFSVEEAALNDAVRTGHDPNQSWLILGGSAAAVLAFFIGGLLFVLNLVLAITRRLRAS